MKGIDNKRPQLSHLAVPTRMNIQSTTHTQKSPSKRTPGTAPNIENKKQQTYTKQQHNVLKNLSMIVEKRHRSLLHIQKVFTTEGNMWMNCIKVNRGDIQQLIMSNSVSSTAASGTGYFRQESKLYSNTNFKGQENNSVYMKLKIERYYNLGVSLSKCLGLFDCVNFIQYLLNLMEEYEVYIIMQNQKQSQI